MERLTKRQAFTIGNTIYAKCEHCENKLPQCYEVGCQTVTEALRKLAAYEDAEEQGRLVVLPCKVGDTVYRLKKIDCCDCEYACDCPRLCPEKCPQKIVKTKFTLAKSANIYLTRVEAEAALRKENGEE